MAGDAASLDEWEDEALFEFPVPPPPPPHQSLGPVCELRHCPLEGGPVGAHFNRAQFPSLPIIAVCSSVVLVAVLVASFLLWRHKTKVQNLLPCKNEQPGRLGEMGAANGVNYEDILNHHHPSRIPQTHLTGTQGLMPLELLDVKLGEIGNTQLPTLHHPPCYPTRDITGGRPFHSVYEEVIHAPNLLQSTQNKSFRPDFKEGDKRVVRSSASEGDFGEEEFSGSGPCSATSSVCGSTGGDLCREGLSSDEGTPEDSEFMVHDLPNILPEDPFSYSRRPDLNGVRGNYHCHPYSERAVDVGHKSHSKPNKKLMSPSRVPSSAVYAPRHPSGRGQVRTVGAPQWSEARIRANANFPTSASQENIYSTIDEDELVDFPTQSPLPSLNSQRDPKCRRDSPAGTPSRRNLAIPPLSQRKVAENGGSYGDMMPAFHSASFM